MGGATQLEADGAMVWEGAERLPDPVEIDVSFAWGQVQVFPASNVFQVDLEELGSGFFEDFFQGSRLWGGFSRDKEVTDIHAESHP